MNILKTNIIVLILLSSITLLNSKETVSNEILFEKYECIETDFKLVEPDFSSNSDYKKFKTIVTEKCKEGINFADKYTVVTWGCGINCQVSILVDRTNGKIYDRITSTYGVNFKIESRLIIVNDASYISENSTPLDTTKYYIVNEGELEKIIP